MPSQIGLQQYGGEVISSLENHTEGGVTTGPTCRANVWIGAPESNVFGLEVSAVSSSEIKLSPVLRFSQIPGCFFTKGVQTNNENRLTVRSHPN